MPGVVADEPLPGVVGDVPLLAVEPVVADVTLLGDTSSGEVQWVPGSDPLFGVVAEVTPVEGELVVPGLLAPVTLLGCVAGVGSPVTAPTAALTAMSTPMQVAAPRGARRDRGRRGRIMWGLLNALSLLKMTRSPGGAGLGEFLC